MPSSYTANGGIRLPASGEESGTWGDIVNTNMEIIDRLTNGVTTISLAGTTHTLSTGDGTLSEGQYGVIILGGAPSGTNTITIAPNDGQHVYIVKNSSGQSAIFSQGSGSNVTIPNGTSKIIATDGAGSGAAVTDVTSVLQLSSIDNTPIGITTRAAGDFTYLNAQDGLSLGGTFVTSTATELNVLYGITSTTAELNLLDGVTATTAELNYVDGVTSAIQTQMDLKAPLASPTLDKSQRLTTPTLDSTITITGGTASWTAVASGTTLTFAYDGANIMQLDSSGNLTVIGNVTAYGVL
jgi:hypothetical protein